MKDELSLCNEPLIFDFSSTTICSIFILAFTHLFSAPPLPTRIWQCDLIKCSLSYLYLLPPFFPQLSTGHRNDPRTLTQASRTMDHLPQCHYYFLFASALRISCFFDYLPYVPLLGSPQAFRCYALCILLL